VLRTEAPDERVTHALQLFSSMLWAFRGSMNVTWTASAPAEAEVVVIHRQASSKDAELWRARGKILIEICAGSAAGDARSLVYPFRADQVRALLERLDAELRGETSVNGRTGPSFAGETWRFVESMRAMRVRADERRWFVGRQGDNPVLYVQSNAATFLAEESTVAEIRSGTLNLNSLRLDESVPPASGARLRSGLELLWFAAYHAGERLVPSFDTASQIKLARWPNVSAIRPAPVQLRITAALAGGESTVERLAARVRVEQGVVVRTINALAAANLVVASRSVSPGAVNAWQPEVLPRSGFGAFLRGVRRHLGLGASA
jgi:hypothetical protein